MLGNLFNAYTAAATFFKPPSPTVATPPLIVMPDHDFSLSSEQDLEIIRTKIQTFNTALSASMVIDDQIQKQYLYALGCLCGSFIFGPAILGTCHFFEKKGELNQKHDEAVKTYRDALKELKVILQWVQSGTDPMQQKIHHADIQNLINALGPVLPGTTIKIWQDGDLEDIPGTLGFGGHKLSDYHKDKLREFAKGTNELTLTYLMYSEKATGYISGAAQLAAAKPLNNAISVVMQAMK